MDGSVIISYAADSHSLYGEMYRWPAKDWPKGAMLDVIEWDTHKPLGKIPQVAHTYSVVGNMVEMQGKFFWNVYKLFDCLKESLVICAQQHIALDSIGIDTWGVDFGYLSKDGTILGLPRAYRDPYTVGAPEKYFERLPREEVYKLTGIQIMNFNSLFQLFAAKEQDIGPLRAADEILFMPDLLSYLLTGVRVCEYTDASTSQILNPRTKTFEKKLLEAAGVPTTIMKRSLIFIFVLLSLSLLLGNAQQRDSRTRFYLSPTRIVWQQNSEQITGADNLLRQGNGQTDLQNKYICKLKSTDKLHPAILLDFGKELQGGLQLVSGMPSSHNPIKIRIRFGESASEAMCDIDGKNGATNDHGWHSERLLRFLLFLKH